MRGDAEFFELETPGRLDDVLALLRSGHRPLAGGTDVMVLLASGKLEGHRWVDLTGLEDLRGIEVGAESLVIGALTTYTDLRRSAVVQREFPNLVEAARLTGGVAIQNRGTLGGNIGNASPAADSLPALLSYDAELELVSASGSRRVPYGAFHTGYKQTVAAPSEIVARVRLPRAGAGQRLHYYRKVGPRQAQAISKVCMAASVRVESGRVLQASVALGGVAPVPLRCRAVEQALTAGDVAAARSALALAIAPIDDARSTARYRRRVAENLLAELVGRVGDVELDR